MRGFTLVEILIVIGIIVLLASVLLVSFGGVFAKRDVAVCKTRIETLKTNLEAWEARMGQGEYPPSNLIDMGAIFKAPLLVENNKTNRGIETMIVALRVGMNGGPFLDAELFSDPEAMGNTDNDSTGTDAKLKIDGPMTLFEAVDPWGNPLVYINARDIMAGKIQDTVVKGDASQEILDPKKVQELLKHPTTGAYPTGYALWSFGPNGQNEYGRGDDVTSWPKYD